jgi:hypothetical protein
VTIYDPIQATGLGMMTLPREITPDEGDYALDGYYYLKTDEFLCTCRNKPWRFLHYENKIIVWPTNDDDSLLKNAQRMKELGLNPKITEYKITMGKAIAWEDIPNGSTIG